jgi:pyruvate formate lyase activating enzyme
MRCKYCHNPDTWDAAGGEKKSVQEILEDYERYRPFMINGGLTVTGGEPLTQIDFLLELFTEAKKRNIHTCLDTSGIMFRRNVPEIYEKYLKLAKVTDLVMLDIKHIDPEEHKKLTGQPNDNILDFLKFLDEQGIDIWIRHVIVPGITFIPKYLEQLGTYIAHFRHIKALDVLPYHDMGKTKYEQMGIDYVLKDVKPLNNSDAKEARDIVVEAMRKERHKMNEEAQKA